MRPSLRHTVILALFALGACGDGTASAPRAKTIGCASDFDCGQDEICADRLCVLAPHGGTPIVHLEDGGSAAEDGGASLPDGGASLPDGGAAADGGSPADGGALADGGRVDGGNDGGVDGGRPDGGRPDAGVDGGAPRFCQPCTSDSQCGGMKCVTTERSGERFCSPICQTSDTCPSGSACATFIVTTGNYCLPTSGTCVAAACTAIGCPAETPLCDSSSGRCYRTESKTACYSCSYSFQCGGFWDRCITLTDSSRVCGRDCDSARSGTCTSGYRCAEITAATGEVIRQCVPLTSTCAGCRADNPCTAGADRYCDVASGTCVARADVGPSCSPCDHNSDCGPVTATCYQGGCMPYCDTYTPCSAGYRCTTVTDSDRGAQVRRCIPNAAANQSCETLLQCSRCTSDDNCNGGKCYPLSSTNRRCVAYCDALGSLCPSGSTCTLVGTDSLCVPTSCSN